MTDFVTCTYGSRVLTIEKGTHISEILSPEHKTGHICGGKGTC